MIILGIESSCDECSASVVKDGKIILSLHVASQIPVHQPYSGVVPELASRTHLAWIRGVVEQAIHDSGLTLDDIDVFAATKQPGLGGSLIVGHTFARTLAWAKNKPFVGIDHMLAHLYAVQLEQDIPYPFLGLLVSGGHSMIVKVNSFDTIEVLGASIDDAVGEAFDKVASHYGLGYPGGRIIDEMARKGDSKAFMFPIPNLYKGEHTYDVSYSGLKNAAINQLDIFWNKKSEKTIENIVASFERVAIEILLKKIYKAVELTGIKTLVTGGGVSANSLLRRSLSEKVGLEVYQPSMSLCGDNAAMVAGLAFQYAKQEQFSSLDETVVSRVSGFKKINL